MKKINKSLIAKKKKLFDQYAAHITDERRATMMQVIKERTRHISVVLEDVYQAHNISAALRSADCFGIQDVHIIEHKNRFKVAKDIAKGATQWLSIEQYPQQKSTDITRCFNKLRNNGYKIIATTPHKDDVLIQDLPIDSKLALVFGTEQEGLSDAALKEADGYVKVPLYGFTESFNISVCAGIVLYELTKRLRESSYDWRLTEEEQIDLLLEWLCRTTTLGPIIRQQLSTIV